MRNVYVNTKITLAKIPNRQAFWKEIEKGMRFEGQEYKKEYRKWVDTWESKPRFKVTIRRNTRKGEMTGIVSPTADEGLLQIMDWLNLGTGVHRGGSAYPIRPKEPGYPLRFRETYTPATQPGVIQSGQKSYSGGLVQTYEVMHPGIRARNIVERIITIRSAKFFRGMHKALNRAMIASFREGKTSG
jgi:hypothetical protein